jgi:hypothetical protein
MFGMLLKHSPLSKDAGGGFQFSVFSSGDLFRPGMEGLQSRGDDSDAIS